MTTKAILYYALRVQFSTPKIIAVTSTKPGRYYGHSLPDKIGTHGKNTEIHGRFNTVEDAENAKATVVAIKAKHKPLIEAANDAITAAYRAERAEYEAIFHDA